MAPETPRMQEAQPVNQKWPAQLTIVRHGRARFNDQLWQEKLNDPLYKRLVRLSDSYPDFSAVWRDWISVHGWRTRLTALRVERKYRRTKETHEYSSPLTDEGRAQMREVGAALCLQMKGKLPDFIFVGLAPRLEQSLDAMSEGWPELKNLLDKERQLPEKDRIVHKDNRVDEQDFGLVSTYTDPRVYYAWHPRQKFYKNFASPYRYRYPQGESINDLRDRSREALNKIVRDHKTFGFENVLVISSTYWALSTIANIEGWDDEKFLSFYNEPGKTKLRNGGIIIFKHQDANPRHPEGYLHQELYNATPDEVRAYAVSQKKDL